MRIILNIFSFFLFQVLEEINIKHAVIKEFETVLPKHAVIASNTSGLKVKDIASVSARPENIVGMHYFSPVDKVSLLFCFIFFFLFLFIYFLLVKYMVPDFD